MVANLPYNVATPLVMRLLEEVDAVDALLVMVQREVGERMAAGPGDPAYGGVSVRIAYFAHAALAGRVPASASVRAEAAGGVRARPHPPPGLARGRPGRGVVRPAGRGETRPASGAAPQDAAPLCSPGRWRRIRSCGVSALPRRGPRSSCTARRGGGWPRRDATRMAPAKLTVSLRVTGVRSDGFHELDAEMVTLDLADELELEEGGAGITVAAAPGTRADALPRPEENLVSRALVAAGRAASVHVTKRIPLGGGLGGGSRRMRLRCCASGGPHGAAMVALGIGADVPFCLVGGRARVVGAGERVIPLPFERREYLLLVPPFGVDTRDVYRAWDDRPSWEGPNHLARAALAVEPRLAMWRDALGEASGVEPRLAGSGSTWFVEGATDSVSEARVDGARVPPGTGPHGSVGVGRGLKSGLLAGPALPAGGLEHLLVLLLAHPLAALLDQ